MRTLRIFVVVLLVSAVCILAVKETMAETRTLTTRIVVTVRDPNTQPAQVPKGLEELYNIALSQNINQRMVKTEEPINTPGGLPRYTMTEKL